MATQTQLEAVNALYEQLVNAATSGDADRYAALFTDYAVLMPPNAPIVAGRAAIRHWASRFFQHWILEASAFSIDKQEVGDTVAFCRYSTAGKYLPKPDGDPIPYDQKYMDALVKDSDNSWKFAAHMWSSNNKERSVWNL
ncbi:MAG: SgcJ/EcaC family oxidoreductase [Chloroflexi bacterium]|nr:SgcJ/EcaC family oxidoreductase [Chloroflexota bacterium]